MERSQLTVLWSVIAAGGATMYGGITERLEPELQSLVTKTPFQEVVPDLTANKVKIKLIAPPERKYTVWIGGSIWSSLSEWWPSVLKKSEYDDYGPDAATYRFFV